VNQHRFEALLVRCREFGVLQMENIKAGMMVFLADGQTGIGSVREISSDQLVIQVENAGDFALPMDAVHTVHFDKVVLSPDKLDPGTLNAMRHAHDKETENY
jgi:hypothetical protein